MSIPSDKTVWIGLVTIEPSVANVGFLGTYDGAFVNAVALCGDADEFRELVRKQLSAFGLTPTEFEDLEPLALRVMKHVVNDDLLALEGPAVRTGEAQLGEFYLFPPSGS